MNCVTAQFYYYYFLIRYNVHFESSTLILSPLFLLSSFSIKMTQLPNIFVLVLQFLPKLFFLPWFLVVGLKSLNNNECVGIFWISKPKQRDRNGVNDNRNWVTVIWAWRLMKSIEANDSRKRKWPEFIYLNSTSLMVSEENMKTEFIYAVI